MSDLDKLTDKTCVMLGLQEEMNRRVDPDWRERGRAWYRAIWIECAELMDHWGGWKWWKHSSPDLPQVVLEIVDIWHFGLSQRLDEGAELRETAARIAAEWLAPPAPLPFLEETERLARAALEERAFAVGALANLLAHCGRDFDDLYRAYVAKNVLNVFRQDKGYREGSYVKIWGGREDNVVLAELIERMDCDRADFRGAIYAELETRYLALTGG